MFVHIDQVIETLRKDNQTLNNLKNTKRSIFALIGHLDSDV